MGKQQDYISRVHAALSAKVEGFKKDEATFRKDIQSQEYASNVYKALASKVEGFKKTEDDFYAEVGLKKKDLSQQDLSSGFAPSQGIKPGTSIFPQQQALTQPSFEKKYKAKAATKPLVEDIGLMDNYVGYIAGKLIESGVTSYPNIQAAVSDISDYVQSKITGENIYTMRPGGIFGPAYEIKGLSQEGQLALQQGRQEQIKQFGDAANVLTTQKYEEDLAKRASEKSVLSPEFITTSLGSITESIGGNVGSFGFGYAANMFNDLNIEGQKNGLTPGESLLYAGLVSGGVTAIDRAGLGYLTKSMPKKAKVELGKYIASQAMKSLSKAGVEVTEEVIEKYINLETKKVKNKLISGGVKGIIGGATESGTEVLQEVGTIGAEQLTNLIKDREVFKSGDITDRVVRSAVGGFIGGKAVGGIKGYVGDGETYNFIKEGVRETYNDPAAYDDFRIELGSQLQEQNIPEETQTKILEEVDNMRNKQMSIPEETENRDDVSDIIEMRDEAAQQLLDIDNEVIDPAFEKDRESRKSAIQDIIVVLNDAALATKDNNPITYRQTEAGFEKESNGKVEQITEAQFNYAKDNGVKGIKIEVVTAPIAEQVDATVEGIGAVVEQGVALTEEQQNRIADIETELQNPDLDEETRINLQQELDNINATQESSQQVIQGGEQGNQLQREGTQEGQPETGQGEGGDGQTTQSEADNRDSNIKGKAKQIADVVRKAKIAPPGTFQSALGPQVWDTAIEMAAQAIEAGGSIAQAVDDAVKYIKQSDWYKSLDDDRKKLAVADFKNTVKENLGTKRGVVETVEGVAELEDVGKAAADKAAAYYTPQTIEEGSDFVDDMSEAEKISMVNNLFDLTKLFQDKNFSVLAAISLINDYVAQGRDDMAEALVLRLANAGTLLGQMIQQFSTLKTSTAKAFMFAFEKALNKKGVKLTDGQKARVEALFNDAKSKADLAQKAIAKHAAEQTPSSMAEMYAALDASDQANRAIEKFMERMLPKSIFRTLGQRMQGNMLLFKSLISNPVYNLLAKTVDIPKTEVAAIVDRIWAKYRYNTKDRTIRSNFSRDVLSRTPQAIWRGVINAKNKALYGTSSANLSKMDVEENLNPVEAFKQLKIQLTDLFNTWADATYQQSEELATADGKKFDTERFLANLLQISPSGLSATVMLRGLPFGDDPFFEPAKLVELINIGKNKGLSGRDLDAFIINPDKESLARAEEIARGAVFQDDNAISDAVNSLNRALGRIWPEFPALGEFLKFAIVKTTLPFVKTPSNVLLKTINYAVPTIPLLRAMITSLQARHWVKKYEQSKLDGEKNESFNNKSKEYRRIMAENAGYFAIGMSFKLLSIALSEIGAIEGDEDDKEDKKKKAWQWATSGGPNTINVSKVKRWLTPGETTESRPTDKKISLYALGLPGAMLYIDHQSLKETKKDKGKIDLATGKPVQITNVMKSQLFSPLSTAGSAGAFILDQGFAQGAGALASAVADNEWDKYLNKIATAGVIAFAPNTIDQFSRLNRAYMKVPYTEDGMQTFVNQMKIKFGQDKDLPIRRGLFGEPIKQTPKGADPTVYQFIDIFKTADAYSAPIYFELDKLMEQSKKVIGNRTGDDRLIPSIPTNDIQYNGKTYFLNPTLYSKYLEYVGVDRMDLLLQVLDGQTEYTQELGDMIDQAYSQGQELGKERFLEEFSENLDEN
jgi:hypothetical protein